MIELLGFVESPPSPDGRLGDLSWPGSFAEIDYDLKHLTKERDRARTQLAAAVADAMLTDEERAAKDAADRARVAELNARPERCTRFDGSVYDRFPGGRIVEVSPAPGLE